MSNRLENTIIEKPIIFGNAAFALGKDDVDGASHKWTVFLRGVVNENLSYFIKEVRFRLHESFKEPERIVKSPPYEVTEFGWGEFAILITVVFHDEAEEPPIAFQHNLRLFAELKENKRADNPAKKPVMTETYDEIVFVDPTAEFYKMLTSPISEPLPPNPLEPFFNTSSILDVETKQLARLTTAHESVTSNIERLRGKLYELETEIALLEEIHRQQLIQKSAEKNAEKNLDKREEMRTQVQTEASDAKAKVKSGEAGDGVKLEDTMVDGTLTGTPIKAEVSKTPTASPVNPSTTIPTSDTPTSYPYNTDPANPPIDSSGTPTTAAYPYSATPYSTTYPTNTTPYNPAYGTVPYTGDVTSGVKNEQPDAYSTEYSTFAPPSTYPNSEYSETGYTYPNQNSTSTSTSTTSRPSASPNTNDVNLPVGNGIVSANNGGYSQYPDPVGGDFNTSDFLNSSNGFMEMSNFPGNEFNNYSPNFTNNMDYPPNFPNPKSTQEFLNDSNDFMIPKGMNPNFLNDSVDEEMNSKFLDLDYKEEDDLNLSQDMSD